MNRFTVSRTSLEGVLVVDRKVAADARGNFSRLFCAEELRGAGWTFPIAQINQSVSAGAGTVRGLHFQRPPFAEQKQVICLRGEIWDVAVDVRADSPTFLRWHGERLSAENNRAMIIPQGFAHGFQCMTPDVEVIYFSSALYSPDYEVGLDALDEALAISWPLPVSMRSDRDQSHAKISASFAGLKL